MNLKENYVKLGDYIKIITGKQLNKDRMFKKGLYPVINGGTSPTGYFNEYNQEANTITIAQGGSTGYVDFQKTEFWASAHCYVVKPKNEKILLNKYLYYFLKNNELNLKKQSHGAGIPSLAKEHILNLDLILPDIKTQKEIVKNLDLFTNFSEELEAELEARKKQYNFYRNKLLHFEYLTNFKTYNLEDIAEFEKGKTNIAPDKGTRFPIVSGGVKPQGYTDEFNRNKNSITVSSSGSAGYVSFWKTPIFAKDCFTIQANEKIILQKYLFHFLKNKQDYIYSLKTTGTIPHIYSSTISDMKILVPDLLIQQKIVDVLDNFEKICQDLNIGLPAEIELRDKQYAYYRDKLLSLTSNIFEETARSRDS
ncbi:restriction modification enzyme subunit S2A [Mycoplasmopsis citelli]|uniref:Restriction modification enzyme subunit S2A n=1 Tax=Mycoplasmopsis citelli TaxID=171281 RepID=A0A449B0T5_9BACT|nr:restriction endonuclease subunit S [Mycoplasmopsis citelli]VEU74210.1 restriction modification enzyme subunit S2A [Mycoplasmopsis citelli]